MSIPRSLRQQVIQAANHRCEYAEHLAFQNVL
mgnify:CR=1 FL=1